MHAHGVEVRAKVRGERGARWLRRWLAACLERGHFTLHFRRGLVGAGGRPRRRGEHGRRLGPDGVWIVVLARTRRAPEHLVGHAVGVALGGIMGLANLEL